MNKSFVIIPAAVAFVMASAGCGRDSVVADYNVVPLPNEIETDLSRDGFLLTEGTPVVYAAGSESLSKNAGMFAESVEKIAGLKLDTAAGASARRPVILRENLDAPSSEAYSIEVCADSIVVDGASAAGVFYGLQTLCKAIPADADRDGVDVVFPAGKIYDYPRYAYRGALLDTSRHFFSADSVKSFIDMLALHNINRFHWHITDDQGWRIEIKSRPELAEKGQWRSGTVVGAVKEGEHVNENVYDSIPYSGYYTQQEVRDIVAYAADRHVTVVPEIDLPGHMQAALAVYPELGCTGGPYEVWCRWGVSEDVLCAGNDSVYAFLEDVLEEVVDLFPSELIHIGGDECPKVRWEQCPKCQAKIRQLGLKDDDHSTAEQKLQTHVMSYASSILGRHGRRIIGWDEILEGGVPDGAVVMSWRGVSGGEKAARQGHDVILTPHDVLYLDFVQSADPGEPQAAHWGHPVTVEDVFRFNPEPEGLSESEMSHIIGLQANLWCEYVPTMKHAQYMAFPRLAALSEVQWRAAGDKDYDDFVSRLERLSRHYDLRGFNYARHAFKNVSE